MGMEFGSPLYLRTPNSEDARRLAKRLARYRSNLSAPGGLGIYGTSSPVRVMQEYKC